MSRVMHGLLLLLALVVFPCGAQTVEYIHTDALGSPVAITDQNGNVVERTEYEPYGRVLTPASPKDGPGYTGHVFDSATGLNYMQQRYYDPGIGRFLSVDPVTAHEKPGENFNRYWYANNNPYKFTDPDGRIAFCAVPPITFGCIAVGKAIVDTIIVVGAAVVIAAPIVVNNEPAPDSDSPSPENSDEPASGGQNDSGTRTPAPFLPDDPYSPEETSRRQSGNREAEGAPSRDPDSPIPDRNPGSDQGGHATRGRTPHSTGERNVNSNEEHSRRPKGNPSGRER